MDFFETRIDKKTVVLVKILVFFILCYSTLGTASPTPFKIQLIPIAEDFEEPTDIQFVPQEPLVMVVLEKPGKAYWFDIKNKTRGLLFKKNVLTWSEEGLLGLAFHSNYPNPPCFYTNYVSGSFASAESFVTEWCAKPNATIKRQTFKETRVVLSVSQPFPNHNAGQLVFGPDGYLYIPWGDGGLWGDPHRNGQNLKTWLGSILRVKITPPGSHPTYEIPETNPFYQHPFARKEIYAYGFRNPWRVSFDPFGRLIVADAGEKSWEEITMVVPGGNHGWNIKEGAHCYPPHTACSSQNLVDPIFEYSPNWGRCIIGGYVWLSPEIPALQNHYLFGDFVSGRLGALEILPPPKKQGKLLDLGAWEIAPSTFGRDTTGRVYVADYSKGVIYRLDAKN